MRRAAGWIARVLRLFGNLAEVVAFLLLFVVSRGEATFTEIPEFWTETRRGRLKGVRGWLRSTVICTLLMAPAFIGLRDNNSPTGGDWFIAAFAGVMTFGVLSAPVALVVVWLGRALGAPRPAYDMLTTALAAGLGGVVVLLPQDNVSLWLWYWPATVGVFWGWLYWFYAYRPHPPYEGRHA